MFKLAKTFPTAFFLASGYTESLYLALFIWAAVYFTEFVQEQRVNGWTDEARRSLWKCGAVLAGACLTRYDGWFLASAIAALVLWMGWRRRAAGASRAVVVFVILAAAVPVLWFAYNGIIYRNPLEFANGPYSARAIEKRTAVPGFFRALPRHCESEPAWANGRIEACPARRQLEVALQQPAGDHPQLKRPELFLQRSRLPDRVRVRIANVIR